MWDVQVSVPLIWKTHCELPLTFLVYRVRRVKCDEEKPFCRRCQQFNVTCDGYSNQFQAFHSPPSPGADGPPLLPRPQAFSPSPIQPLPPPIVFETKEEEKYFSIFKEKSALQASSQVQPEGWRRILLQSCNIPTVLHGVIALGALTMTVATACSLGDALTGYSQLPDAHVHHQVALLHYSKALECMKHNIASGNQDLRTILITSLIILCFEVFHGNFAGANTQVQSAMLVIQEWRASFHGINSPTQGASSLDTNIVEDDLIQIFTRLDTQSFLCDDTTPAEQQKALREQDLKIIESMPTFTTIEMARMYLELILRRYKYAVLFPNVSPNFKLQQRGREQERKHAGFITTTIYKEESLVRLPRVFLMGGPRLEKTDEGLLSNLLHWNENFRLLMSRLKFPHSAATLTLQLYYKTWHILSHAIDMDEMIFDQFTEEFKEILNTSKTVLEMTETSSSIPSFTLSLGVLRPLFLVGLKCRNVYIRREAIEILAAKPRREGLYDSGLCVKCAQWVEALENRYRVAGIVPSWARIGAIAVNFGREDRRGTMFCHQRKRPDDIEGEQMTADVSW
jgi:hypothetical protein